MEKAEQLFDKLKQEIISNHEGVHEGTMMGSPGIQYNKKNFTFLYRQTVAFRAGRDFEPESEGIHDYTMVNPFKNKPALKDWFAIGPEYSDKWPLLAEIALQRIRKGK
ncbi:MAG: hypothetical protein Roseis2KO_46720 [Roseivirga sp.]